MLSSFLQKNLAGQTPGVPGKLRFPSSPPPLWPSILWAAHQECWLRALHRAWAGSATPHTVVWKSRCEKCCHRSQCRHGPSQTWLLPIDHSEPSRLPSVGSPLGPVT